VGHAWTVTLSSSGEDAFLYSDQPTASTGIVGNLKVCVIGSTILDVTKACGSPPCPSEDTILTEAGRDRARGRG